MKRISLTAWIFIGMAVGVAVANAILLATFAEENRRTGHSAPDAAVEGAKHRLRPILMTSIAFIAGVFPLVKAHGAGAEMRQAMGIAVFSGMIGVTLFGLFLTPVFYVALMKLGFRKSAAPVMKPETGMTPAPAQ